jgi:hypothetical protein
MSGENYSTNGQSMEDQIKMEKLPKILKINKWKNQKKNRRLLKYLNKDLSTRKVG